MRLGAFILLVLVTPASGLAGQSEPEPRPAVTPSHARSPGVLLRQLPGLRQAFAMVRRELSALPGEDVPAPDPRAVARWAEFEQLVNALMCRPGDARPLAYRDALAAFLADGPLPVPLDADVVARDQIVRSMAMAGYGPKAIADVVSGRLTMEVLEQAAKRRLLGHTEAEIARYLEAHRVTRAAAPPGSRAGQAARGRFDDAVVRHAQQRAVDPDLVRAVITHESAWNSAARSRKGAIGLMQLMPETARLLGVNPVDPEQNIAGGIRYLADLGARFAGNLDAVLVAYIAGPAYAQRWLRGQTALDDEVRAYLANVKASYRRPGDRRPDRVGAAGCLPR